MSKVVGQVLATMTGEDILFDEIQADLLSENLINAALLTSFEAIARAVLLGCPLPLRLKSRLSLQKESSIWHTNLEHFVVRQDKSQNM